MGHNAALEELRTPESEVRDKVWAWPSRNSATMWLQCKLSVPLLSECGVLQPQTTRHAKASEHSAWGEGSLGPPALSDFTSESLQATRLPMGLDCGEASHRLRERSHRVSLLALTAACCALSGAVWGRTAFQSEHITGHHDRGPWASLSQVGTS